MKIEDFEVFFPKKSKFFIFFKNDFSLRITVKFCIVNHGKLNFLTDLKTSEKSYSNLLASKSDKNSLLYLQWRWGTVCHNLRKKKEKRIL